MAQTYRSSAQNIDYTNNTGSDIANGQLLALNTLVAIAINDIPNTESGVLNIDNHHELPKTTGQAHSIGQVLYLSVSTQRLTTASSGNTRAGICLRPAASADTTTHVWLNR